LDQVPRPKVSIKAESFFTVPPIHVIMNRVVSCSLVFSAVNGVRLSTSPKAPQHRPYQQEEVHYAFTKDSEQREDMIKEAYRKADLMDHVLQLHPTRNSNCKDLPDKGFPYDAYELSSQKPIRKPEASDWLRLLRGKRVVFLGDSLVRDFFTSFVRGLIDHMQWHTDKSLWRNLHFGKPDQSGVHIPDPVVEAQFSGNVSAEFWWAANKFEAPPTGELGDHNMTMLGRADLVIFGIGAGMKNKERLMNDISHFWHGALKEVAAKGRLVWMQYPSPHFARGHLEFEDKVDMVDDGTGFMVPKKESSCRAAGPFDATYADYAQHDNKSDMSIMRLSADDFFREQGVPILQLWNVTRPLYNNHPWTTSRIGGGKSGHNSDIDCRHWCNPGLALDVWESLLWKLVHGSQ